MLFYNLDQIVCVGACVGEVKKHARKFKVFISFIRLACDVTARDLQRSDPTFARAKSFDTFCPLGPAIQVEPDLDELEVITRVNGEVRQSAHCRDMLFGILDLLSYASRMMTLEAGDVILTGTPEGVGPLADGDVLEVEVSDVGVLDSPVEAWRRS